MHSSLYSDQCVFLDREVIESLLGHLAIPSQGFTGNRSHRADQNVTTNILVWQYQKLLG
jgi:hypothetical protein